MTKKFEYKGHEYWVTVDAAIHEITKETVFVAYIGNEEPGGLFYGSLIKDGKGNVLIFGDELSAFTNANAIKHGEIDSRG